MSIPQYITQLTKEWLRDVSKRLVAGNCIRLKEDADTREVAVDIDALKLQIGAGGLSSSITVVTGVTWTGSALTMTKQALTFTDGLLTAAGSASTSTIDTAVLFEQS